MAYGGTYGSSALQPDDNEFNYSNDSKSDYSAPTDYSGAADYSNPNSNSKVVDISSRLKNTEESGGVLRLVRTPPSSSKSL